jgi:hypothetical protein
MTTHSIEDGTELGARAAQSRAGELEWSAQVRHTVSVPHVSEVPQWPSVGSMFYGARVVQLLARPDRVITERAVFARIGHINQWREVTQ